MASSARSFARALKATPSASAFKTATRSSRFIVPRQIGQQSRRGYSSSGPATSSSSGLIAVAAALAAGAGGYFYFNGNGSLLSGSASETTGIFTPKFEDYQKVYNEIAQRLEEKDDYDDGSYGPVLVRLAWHASGTYDKDTKTGGSNGATMRFAPEGDHGANAGLVAARDFMEPIKRECPAGSTEKNIPVLTCHREVPMDHLL
jgi:cytochrome c peroxidase